MPPKKAAAGGGESKKAVQKKKAQLIEDKTFGLKNKNKSKKVQQQVKSIEKNVLNSGDPKLRKLEEERKAQRTLVKAQRKAMEDERNALFGEALLAVQKKNKNTNMQEGKMEAKGRDGNDDGDAKKGTSRAMKMMYQMDAQEMAEKLREDPNYVPTIEDDIEQARQLKVAELKASGKAGTPVTAETFAAWYNQKRQRKLEAAKQLVEAELKKKKGGKGLGVLSGRALFEYKRELFQDGGGDDDANGDQERGEVFDLSKLAREQMEEDDENERNNNDNDHNQSNGDNGERNDYDDDFAATEQPTELTNGVAAQMDSQLFLQGDDDDLDDLLE